MFKKSRSASHAFKVLLLATVLLPLGILLAACTKPVNASTVSLGNNPVGIHVVSAPRPLDDISGEGHRVRYFQGETEFDFADLLIEVNLPNRKPFVEPVTFGMIEEFAAAPFCTTATGLQEFTIRWGQFRTKFQVLVEPRRAEFISVTVAPRVIDFNLNDNLNVKKLDDLTIYEINIDDEEKVFDIREGMEVTVKMNDEPTARVLRGADIYEYVQIVPGSFEIATSVSGVNRRIFVDCFGARTSFTINVMNAKRGKYNFEGIFLNEDFALDIDAILDETKKGKKGNLYGVLKPLLHEGLTELLYTMLQDKSTFINALLDGKDIDETGQVREALDVLTIAWLIAEYPGMTLPNPQSDMYRDFMEANHAAGLNWAANEVTKTPNGKTSLLDTVFDVVFRNDALDTFVRDFIGGNEEYCNKCKPIEFNHNYDALCDDCADAGGVMGILGTVVTVLYSLGLEVEGSNVIVDLSAFETVDLGEEGIGELISQLSGSFLAESTNGTRTDPLTNFEFTTILETVFSFIDGLEADIIPDFVDVFFFARDNKVSLGVGIEKIEFGNWIMPINLSIGVGFSHDDNDEEITLESIEVNERNNIIKTKKLEDRTSGTTKHYKYVESANPKDNANVTLVRPATQNLNGIITYADYDGEIQTPKLERVYGIRSASLNNRELEIMLPEQGKNDLLRSLRKFLLADDIGSGLIQSIMTPDFISAQGIVMAHEIIRGAEDEIQRRGGIQTSAGRDALLNLTHSTITLFGAWNWDINGPFSNAYLLNSIFSGNFNISVLFGIINEPLTEMIYEGFVGQLVEQLFGMSYHGNPHYYNNVTNPWYDQFLPFRQRTDPSSQMLLFYQPNGTSMTTTAQSGGRDNVPVYEYLTDVAQEEIEKNGWPAKKFLADVAEPLVDSSMLGLINTVLDVFTAIKVRDNGEEFVKLINHVLNALLHLGYVDGVKNDNCVLRHPANCTSTACLKPGIINIADMLALTVGYNGGVNIGIELLDISIDMPVALPDVPNSTYDWIGCDRPDYRNGYYHEWTAGSAANNYFYLLGYMHNNPYVKYIDKDGVEHTLSVFSNMNGGDRWGANSANPEGNKVSMTMRQSDGWPMYSKNGVWTRVPIEAFDPDNANTHGEVVYRLVLPKGTSIALKFGDRGWN